MNRQALSEEASRLSASLAASGPSDPEWRRQFIEFRTHLFQLGIYDPVLGRYDSYTVAQSESAELTPALDELATTLGSAEATGAPGAD